MEIYSDISHTPGVYFSIHYPVVKEKSLKTTIEEYVEKQKNYFKEFTQGAKDRELNIDFSYQLLDNRYQNILLTTFISSNLLAHPSTTVQTFVFDQKTQTFLTLEQLIKETNWEKLQDLVKKTLYGTYPKCPYFDTLQEYLTEEFPRSALFTLTEEDLMLYFNPATIAPSSCGVLKIAIPLSSIDSKLTFPATTKTQFSPLLPSVKRSIDPNKPVLAFTFDDGPSKYTDSILNLFSQYDGCATFFVLGNKVEAHAETMQKMARLGHEIGNHSYNHQWMSRMSAAEFKEQIDATQQVIFKTTGVLPTRIRPTYGSLSEQIKKNTNLTISLWNIDPKDWKYKDAKTIANRILTKVQDEKVILLHDTHERTVEALKTVLSKLKEAGFQFVTLSELEEIQLLRE